MATENPEPEQQPNAKIDVSSIAFDIAKTAGLADDRDKFNRFEAELIKKIYEIIGLSDIPEQFLTFSMFVDAYSGVLVKSVQNDLAIMNLTKRLAMFKLSGEIQNTAEKPAPQKEESAKPAFVPPTEAVK